MLINSLPYGVVREMRDFLYSEYCVSNLLNFDFVVEHKDGMLRHFNEYFIDNDSSVSLSHFLFTNFNKLIEELEIEEDVSANHFRNVIKDKYENNVAMDIENKEFFEIATSFRHDGIAYLVIVNKDGEYDIVSDEDGYWVVAKENLELVKLHLETCQDVEVSEVGTKSPKEELQEIIDAISKESREENEGLDRHLFSDDEIELLQSYEDALLNMILKSFDQLDSDEQVEALEYIKTLVKEILGRDWNAKK